jgi:nitroreductase
MELKEAILKRRSIRRFGEGDVTKEVVTELIELGNAAPSAGNLQARDFVVVEDQNTKEDLANAAGNQHFIAEAPVVVVVCANMDRILHYGKRGITLYCLQDCAASIQNMLLAIHAMGLGCVWVGAFDEFKVSGVLELPGHIRPVAILPIGRPSSQPAARKRIPVEDLIHYEKW